MGDDSQDDDLSPFTSDEERFFEDSLPSFAKPRAAKVTPAASAAAASRLITVEDVEEWPDTDDEFERSVALNGTVTALATAPAVSSTTQMFPTWHGDGEVVWLPLHPAPVPIVAAPPPTPLRLNRDAKAFSPLAVAPKLRTAAMDYKGILANLNSTLLSTRHVLTVDVKEDASSSCATVSIGLIDTKDYQTESSETIQSAKEAILNATACSQSTYVFGYATQPFQGINDREFAVTLAHCPASKEEKACWDTFETGACPRVGCRWFHPRDSDKRKIHVVIEEDF